MAQLVQRDEVKPRSIIAWFHEIGSSDKPLVGGKGANLGELVGAGIPVPPGYVVTTDAYVEFIRYNELEAVIKRLLHNLDVEDSHKLNRQAELIQKEILNAEMPEFIAQEIMSSYVELGEGFVAVRSSATAEDLAEASFAGQQATFLNVNGANNVVEAVQKCWMSLFGARAIYYRKHAGFDDLKVTLAVPVQRMVQSEAAGVMFTIDPITHDTGKIEISAGYGLGEAVVSGEITPDTYEVRKEPHEVIKVEVEPQEMMLTKNIKSDGDAETANEWVDVPEYLKSVQKLKEDEILELSSIGMMVEDHYRSPQDIEWAMENGRFYIVQSRPVTTVKAQSEASDSDEIPLGTTEVLVSGQPASPGVGVGKVVMLAGPHEIDKVKQGDVIVAEMTTPDYVPAMKRASAIVTDRGGRTCHAAIVSRELGIPCVVGTRNATTILSDGKNVTVNGASGNIHKGVDQSLVDWDEAQKKRYADAANIPTDMKLYVNLAEPELADVVALRTVDGVGLLRAEFIVAQIGKHPRAFIEEGRPEEYTRLMAEGISAFCAAFNPRPVVYRLTDFKTNEYANLTGGAKYEASEENPMIGYRGASRYIRDREVFQLEVDAIKKVREQFHNLYVMVPFVRMPSELQGVKDILEANGLVRGVDNFKLWMMAEVPANALILDKFIDVGIDGISIGSNDLTQLVLGIDRDSDILSDSFDERNEAVMYALEVIVKTGRARGVTVGICGQAPSVYPEITEKLLEWGATSVSVSPDMIEKTRQIIANAERKRKNLN